jgi:sugar lactone lactonase YvrE
MQRKFLSLFILVIGLILLSCMQCHDPLKPEYILSSKDSFPEGVTFDPFVRAFYAGSLEGGTITRIDADGTESIFFESDAEVSFTGIKIDPCRRQLWACASFINPEIPEGEEGFRFGEIWIFNLQDGQKRYEYSLSEISNNARCNDFIIDEKGVGYIPDSQKPNIYSIAPLKDTAKLFASDSLLAPEFTLPDSLRFVVPGSNGVVITPDGNYLLVANTYASTLFRVSLKNPLDIIEVSLNGDEFRFPDGLVMIDELLFAVSSGKIHRVTFSDSTFEEGTVTSIDFIQGTTTGTLAEGQFYVIKGFTNREDEDSDFPFKIIKVDLNLFDDS